MGAGLPLVDRGVETHGRTAIGNRLCIQMSEPCGCFYPFRVPVTGGVHVYAVIKRQRDSPLLDGLHGAVIPLPLILMYREIGFFAPDVVPEPTRAGDRRKRSAR